MAYILPLSRAGDFIVGSAFGCIFIHRARETNTKSAVATLLELAAFGLVVFSLTQSTKELNLKWTGCATWYLPGSVLLVYSFAMHKGLVSKLLTNRLTVWLGDLSAYGFLFHQVIIRYLRILIPKITDADLSKVTYAFISFAVTVAASVIYKKYFADTLAKPLYAAHARISDRLLGKPGEKAAR